jgi:hypothetical protein
MEFSQEYHTIFFVMFFVIKHIFESLQGGLKLQARTLATLPHSLVGLSMTYDVPKILKLIRHLK